MYPRLTASIFFSFILFISCSSESKDETAKEKDSITLKTEDSAVIKKDQVALKSDNCMILLRDLIKGSSLKNRIPQDFSFSIDDSTEHSYILKIYNRNEGNDVAIAWIEFDYLKSQLRDITFDPDNPLLLDFDARKFKEVQQCL